MLKKSLFPLLLGFTLFLFIGCTPETSFESAAADQFLFEPGAANELQVDQIEVTQAVEEIIATMTHQAALIPTSTPYSLTPFPTPTENNLPPTPHPTMTPYETLVPTPLPPTPNPSSPLPEPTPPPIPTLATLPNGCEIYPDWQIRLAQPGETLFTLAQTFQKSPYEIQRANCGGDGFEVIAGREIALPTNHLPTSHVGIPPVTTYAADQCYSQLFPPAVGLQNGGVGVAITYAQGQHVELWQDQTGFIPYVGLLGGDQFDVIEGPVCFTFQSQGSADQSRRRWKVRSAISGFEGWIDEYLGDSVQYLYVSAPNGQQPLPQIDYFGVYPDYPTINDTIYIEWATRNAPGVRLTGGGIDMPPLSPTWRIEIPARDLILDESGCTTLAITIGEGDGMRSADHILCINDNPPLQITQFDVSPQPLIGQGPTQATVYWKIEGFDPNIHSAGFVWYEGGYLTGMEAITAAEGFMQVEVNITLPGSILFRMDAGNGNQSVTQEYIAEVATTCEQPRITNDPTLPQECPSTPIVLANARYQRFEGGVMFWRDTFGEDQPLIIFYNDGTIFAPDRFLWEGHQYPEEEAPPNGFYPATDDFGYLRATQPHMTEKLGWAIEPAVDYQTEWQQIAGHVVVNIFEGQQWRYLIYEGDGGMWVPIAPQHIPSGG